MRIAVTEAAGGLYLVVGPRTNWCLIREGKSVTLVDAAWPKDYELVVESLTQIGAQVGDVEAVVLTHAHPDHVGVAERIRAEQAVPVYAHRDEARHARGETHQRVSIVNLAIRLWRPSVFAFAMKSISEGGLRVPHVSVVNGFDNAPLDVPGRPVPIPTPGHTSGHCSFHLPDKGALITGDALVNENILTDRDGPRLLPRIFTHDIQQADASLDRLAGLDADVLLTGHGELLRMTPAEAVRRARDLSATAGWWDR